jgi:hypothetical protein
MAAIHHWAIEYVSQDKWVLRAWGRDGFLPLSPLERKRKVMMTSALHVMREKQSYAVKMRNAWYIDIEMRCVPKPAITFILLLGARTSKNTAQMILAADVKMLVAKPIPTRNSWTEPSFAFQKIRSGIGIISISPVSSAWKQSWI